MSGWRSLSQSGMSNLDAFEPEMVWITPGISVVVSPEQARIEAIASVWQNLATSDTTMYPRASL